MTFSKTLTMGLRTYNDAINALNSLQSNYANIMAIRNAGIKKNEMSLPEMREWTRRIGYDTAQFDKLNVVHITGTKGKGSTAAFTSSILQQYNDKLPKIGLYTSPHLRTVRERIRINGQPLSEDKFTKYFFQIWDKLENSSSPLIKFPHMKNGAKPGYFKYLTLLSFHSFLQEGCDSCVIEVGIGGEYDSTNIIENPIACGVSLLGIDHTYMLGDNIEEIAWNKGGIFKKNSSCYSVAGQPENGLKVLQERANELGNTLTVVPNFEILDNIKLGIAGDFQKSNASLAAALASTVLQKLNIIEESISLKETSKLNDKIIEGLQQTKWEGRCQTLKDGNKTWYIDGAHTLESIEAASSWYKSVAVKSDRKKVLLFNQQTRDANELLDTMNSVLNGSVQFEDAIFTTNVTWSSGSYSADLVSMNTSKEEVDTLKVQKDLSQKWDKLHRSSNLHVTASIQESVDHINNLGNEPVDIFVTGSLHLVGGLLVVLGK